MVRVHLIHSIYQSHIVGLGGSGLQGGNDGVQGFRCFIDEWWPRRGNRAQRSLVRQSSSPGGQDSPGEGVRSRRSQVLDDVGI